MRLSKIRVAIIAVCMIMTACKNSSDSQVVEELAPEVRSNSHVFRGDLQRTGNYNVSGISQLTGLKWKFETDEMITSSPVIAHDLVLVGSMDSHIYAITLDDGCLAWKFKTGGPLYSSPAIYERIVFFVSTDGFLYAIELPTGALKWKRWVGDRGRSSPALKNGLLFVCGGQRVHALDCLSGETRWEFVTRSGVGPDCSPAICDNLVIVTEIQERMWALNCDTGDVAWLYETRNTFSDIVAVADHNIYVTTGALVSAISLRHGKLLWAPSAANNTVFVSSSNGYTCALRAETGDIRWRTESGGHFAPVSIADGTVYVPSLDGNLYALSESDGSLIWEFEIGSKMVSSPAIADRIVIIGSTDGILYALH